MTARQPYTDEQLEFVRDGYRTMTTRALTAAFNERFDDNRSFKAMKSLIKKLGLKSGRKPGNPRGTLLKFTPAIKDFVREEYQRYPLQVVTWNLNELFDTHYTFKQLRSFTRNHRIRSGRNGQIRRGNRPWNIGTKGVMKANKTSFTSEPRPELRKPMGHERIDRDGYIWIKVPRKNEHTGQPWRYEMKHRVVWEEHHGPIPKGSVIGFIDGDRQNTAIDNLMCLTRNEHRYLHRWTRFDQAPIEIRRSLVALARMKCATFERERESA